LSTVNSHSSLRAASFPSLRAPTPSLSRGRGEAIYTSRHREAVLFHVIASPEWSEGRSNLSVEPLYTSLRGRSLSRHCEARAERGAKQSIRGILVHVIARALARSNLSVEPLYTSSRALARSNLSVEPLYTSLRGR